MSLGEGKSSHGSIQEPGCARVVCGGRVVGARLLAPLALGSSPGSWELPAAGWAALCAQGPSVRRPLPHGSLEARPSQPATGCQRLGQPVGTSGQAL